MTKVLNLSFDLIISALERDGWKVFQQRGRHIRLQKVTEDGTQKFTVTHKLQLAELFKLSKYSTHRSSNSQELETVFAEWLNC